MDSPIKTEMQKELKNEHESENKSSLTRKRKRSDTESESDRETKQSPTKKPKRASESVVLGRKSSEALVEELVKRRYIVFKPQFLSKRKRVEKLARQFQHQVSTLPEWKVDKTKSLTERTYSYCFYDKGVLTSKTDALQLSTGADGVLATSSSMHNMLVRRLWQWLTASLLESQFISHLKKHMRPPVKTATETATAAGSDRMDLVGGDDTKTDAAVTAVKTAGDAVETDKMEKPVEPAVHLECLHERVAFRDDERPSYSAPPHASWRACDLLDTDMVLDGWINCNSHGNQYVACKAPGGEPAVQITVPPGHAVLFLDGGPQRTSLTSARAASQEIRRVYLAWRLTRDSRGLHERRGFDLDAAMTAQACVPLPSNQPLCVFPDNWQRPQHIGRLESWATELFHPALLRDDPRAPRRNPLSLEQVQKALKTDVMFPEYTDDERALYRPSTSLTLLRPGKRRTFVTLRV